MKKLTDEDYANAKYLFSEYVTTFQKHPLSFLDWLDLQSKLTVDETPEAKARHFRDVLYNECPSFEHIDWIKSACEWYESALTAKDEEIKRLKENIEGELRLLWAKRDWSFECLEYLLEWLRKKRKDGE